MSTTFVDVNRLALEVLDKSGAPRTENKIAIDVEAILVERYDVDVALVPRLIVDGTPLSGLYDPSRHLVIVEANDPLVRQRFTLAHELAHVEIHHRRQPSDSLFPLEPEERSFRCPKYAVKIAIPGVGAERLKQKEVVANKFAEALLMPEDLTREIWRKTQDIKACADQLQVSSEAMGYRLKNLLCV